MELRSLRRRGKGEGRRGGKKRRRKKKEKTRCGRERKERKGANGSQRRKFMRIYCENSAVSGGCAREKGDMEKRKIVWREKCNSNRRSCSRRAMAAAFWRTKGGMGFPLFSIWRRETSRSIDEYFTSRGRAVLSSRCNEEINTIFDAAVRCSQSAISAQIFCDR